MEQAELDQENGLGPVKAEGETSATKKETLKKEKKIFFETKSMADVYAKQGHIQMALEIYKRIFDKNSSDSEVEKRILELECKLSSRKEKSVLANRSSKPHGDNST